MKPVIYLTECGCKVERKGLDRLLYIQKNGRKTYRLFCKNHFGGVKNKVSICDKCGKEFLYSMKSTVPFFCKPCKEIEHRRICREAMRKKNGISKPVKKEKELGQLKRVFSVVDAQNKSINCIPLQKLFRFNNEVNSGY